MSYFMLWVRPAMEMYTSNTRGTGLIAGGGVHLDELTGGALKQVLLVAEIGHSGHHVPRAEEGVLLIAHVEGVGPQGPRLWLAHRSVARPSPASPHLDVGDGSFAERSRGLRSSSPVPRGPGHGSPHGREGPRRAHRQRHERCARRPLSASSRAMTPLKSTTAATATTRATRLTRYHLSAARRASRGAAPGGAGPCRPCRGRPGPRSAEPDRASPGRPGPPPPTGNERPTSRHGCSSRTPDRCRGSRPAPLRWPGGHGRRRAGEGPRAHGESGPTPASSGRDRHGVRSRPTRRPAG